MVGVPVTKDRINAAIGSISQRIKSNFDEVATLKAWKDITPQADVQALGFTADEAYLILLIIDELNQLRTIYNGTDSLASAHDFRVQAQKAIGLGL